MSYPWKINIMQRKNKKTIAQNKKMILNKKRINN